jgi:hypothetical protein
VDTAYNPAEWGTFAVGLATASGALTRLVFVAVPIRVKEVLDDPFHRRRTESTFVILLAILTASLLVLMPSQGRVAVGIEMLVVGAVLTYRATHMLPVVRASLRREGVVSYCVAPSLMCSSHSGRSASSPASVAASTSLRRRSSWSSCERSATYGCS